MRSFRVFAAASLLACFAFSTAQATQILVPDPGNGIYTIQDGIDAATDGDEVIVAPGTYEAIDFNGKAITVRSSSGPLETVISTSTAQTAVAFTTGEGNASVLRGFTVTNTYALGYGGIHIAGASPVIEENLIQGCRRYGHGGGMHIAGGSPVIRYNTIRDNLLWAALAGGHVLYGGGIYFNGSGSPRIYNNLVQSNTQSCMGFCLDGRGNGIYISGGSPLVLGNVIAGNSVYGGMTVQYGGGLYLADTSGAVIANNTIYDNTAQAGEGPPGEWGGAGVYLAGSNGSLLFANNIVQDNNGQGVLCGSGVDVTLETNDLYANSAGDVVDCPAGSSDLFVDAQMLDPGNGDFHLLAASPLLEAGTAGIAGTPADDVYRDIRLSDSDGDGTPDIDIGADEFSDCLDTDGDGYGTPASPSCDLPALDCDDADASINPGQTEGPASAPVCADGADNDCDGLLDAADSGCQATPWAAAAVAPASLDRESPEGGTGMVNGLMMLLIPAGAILLVRSRKKRG